MDYLPMSNQRDTHARRARTSPISVFGRRKGTEAEFEQEDLTLGREIFSDSFPLALFNPARVWESLNAVELNSEILTRNNLFTDPSQSPAGPAFDILRTRLSQAMSERGWRRIGITSPNHGCGKSFTAVNLAMALARRPGSRTVLLDLDLRRPNLHNLLGLTPPGPLRDFLDGSQPMESQFLRVGRTLALGLNSEPVTEAGDLLHSTDTAQALEALETQLDPDLVVIDLPPALLSDDVLAMRGKLDAVILVADGTRTTAKEIRACEMLLENRIPLMGVVLNRSQDRGLAQQRYGSKA